MIHITRNSLYEKRWSLLVWLVALFLLTWVTAVFFPSFKQSDAFDQVLQSVPEQLRGLIGDVSNLKSFGGFVSSQIFAFRTPLFLIIVAISLGVGLSAAEEDQGLLQTLLSAPVSRVRVLLEKALALSIFIYVVSFGVFAGLVAGGISIHERYSYRLFAEATLHVASFGVAIGLITLAIGFSIGRRGITIGLASLLAFLDFFIHSFSDSVAILKSTAKFTLFHTYSRGNVTLQGPDWMALLIFLVVSLLFLFVAMWIFRRRDLNN